MRKYDFEKVEVKRVVELRCDVCNDDLMLDEMELQETFSFSQFGGYSSVFGDGAHISIDVCQHCFKRLLGEYCVVD